MMHEGLFSGFWWQRVVTERQIREHGAHIREANSLLSVALRSRRNKGRRKRKAKGNPQEMSSFLLNIPRTTAQGNWLARSETNWIRSSSPSSIEFRVPPLALCQTTLSQSSVATLGLRFNDTPFERSVLELFSFLSLRNFSDNFSRLEIYFSSEFAQS